mgnify:CR=1 FL=1
MKHIGCLIPASNIVAERELYTRLISDNISDICFHFARLKFHTPYGVNEEQYTKELVESIPEALEEMKRIDLHNRVVLCTSAELFSKSDSSLLFPLPAVIDYLKTIKKSSPLVITPYNKTIGSAISQKLKETNINIVKELHLDIKNKEELLCFSDTKLLNLIKNQINAQTDSICVLCTNFATLHLEKNIESELRLPFISSNKAIYWKVIQK